MNQNYNLDVLIKKKERYNIEASLEARYMRASKRTAELLQRAVMLLMTRLRCAISVAG